MQAFTEMSRDELLNESRLIYKQLQKEMRRIGRTSKPLLKDAYDSFQEFKKEHLLRQFSKYDTKDLKNVYRDLKYISQLKTATKEGAIEAIQTFGDTKKFLDSLSKKSQQEFWDIYGKAYKNLMPTMIDRYKYELFEIVSNEMTLGQKFDDIYTKIEEAFKKSYNPNESESEQGERFRENLEILFSDEFDKLYGEYF